jgi:hypothetical protein
MLKLVTEMWQSLKTPDLNVVLKSRLASNVYTSNKAFLSPDNELIIFMYGNA